ncbi:MAG: ribokinase [Clostridia bacterium]|nr:ribokinase [Clostridia bacterium]
MKKILVIGSMNVDFVAPVAHIPAEGETILAGHLSIHTGGKGGNQAFAAAKLGGDVTMLGAVGCDDYGQLLLNSLSSVGVDVSRVKKAEGVSTGMAWIAVSAKGNNSIIVIPGANLTVDKAYIDANLDILAASDVVVMQMEIPLETVAYAAQKAKALGKTVILDPAPAVPGLGREVLQYVDIAKPNETELSILLKDPETAAHVPAAAQALQDRGVANVAVTLGSDGAYLLKADGTGEHFESRPVKAVDTTAAGDSFTAAMALKISQGASLEEAFPFAMRVAEIVVTRPGAQSSIPFPYEIAQIQA